MSSIQITPELLAQGSATPIIQHMPGEKYTMANQDYGMTIGNAVTAKGRHFVCWVGGGDNSKAFFLLSYSDDGENWTEPILAIDPHDEALECDRCTIVGTLWVDPLGRLWLFFNQTLEHFDGRSSNWYIRCDDPDAQTPLWTEPRYISYGCTLNKPIVLDNGQWLLPVSLWARKHISAPFQECYRELDDERMAHLYVSADQGETWRRQGGAVFPDSQFDEHMAVQLQDGRLYMLARTDTITMESYSHDRGINWSKPVPSKIQSINARFHIRRLASGRLLLIKHGKKLEEKPENRSFITAFLSEDEGKSWSDGFVLDERFEISYPDADQGSDGRIYITYDRNRAKDGEILMACVREEDIVAGELQTEGSFVKRVIRKPGRL